MAQFEHLQVFQSMSRSPNARLHAMAELGNGMAVTRWSNAHDARDYLAPSHTTRCRATSVAARAPFAVSNPATRALRINCASCRPMPLSQLAALCALSEYHFARMFQSSFSLPPHRYVLARRLARACHFSNRFRQALGATPRQYRAAFL